MHGSVAWLGFGGESYSADLDVDRNYYASLLIADGADIKEVQTRLRHASAKTTYDTYLHLWPDANESTRATVGAVISARVDSLGGLTEQSRNKVGEP